MAEMKRQVAYKLRISEIDNGDYVLLEDSPNYIVVGGKKISRANLIGTVIEKSENSMMIDDGSGQISLRNFDDNKNYNKYNEGDIVNVVGKIREYNSEKYIVDELVKKIDLRWLVLRKKELDVLNTLDLGETASAAPAKKDRISKKIGDAKEELIDNAKDSVLDEEIIEIEEKKQDNTPKSTMQKIIELIKKIDAGDGAEIEEIIKQVGDCESTIALMIKKGDVFENKAGRVKLL